MNEKQIAQLEARLEQLVEGVFAGLFRRQISAHDIATKLARGMETHVRIAQDDDPRPVAPDKFIIRLNPDVQRRLLKHRPDMPLLLAQHLVELAAQSGYRMLRAPLLKIEASMQLAPADFQVLIEHSEDAAHGTAAMQPVRLDPQATSPKNPHLIINGARSEPLNRAIINIGRSAENDIVVEDPYISRHHLQIRLRFGTYMLFDANSKSGTLVNNVAVSEHRLQTGDVIRIGETQLVFMMDDPPDRAAPQSTDIYNPVDQP